MKADFTRDTFDAAKHYTRVLMQQGRVQLDADWNEQAAILLHYLQTLAADLIGPYGGPSEAPGFEITVHSDSKNLTIGAGHYYVDGILCENGTFSADLATAIRVADKAKDAAAKTGAKATDVAAAAGTEATKYTEEPAKSAAQSVAAAANNAATPGAQPESVVKAAFAAVAALTEAAAKQKLLTSYYWQPNYPLDPKTDPLPPSNFLVYLDVWERLITSYEDGGIREVALGGPDTAARAKVVWQVKTDQKGPTDGNFPTEPPSDTPVTPATTEDAWKKWVNEQWAQWTAKWQPTDPKRGLLKARAKDDATQDLDACAVPPDARYRGTENQLYRVEIHQAAHVLHVDKDNKDIEFPPTFKWSRENGSVIFPIRKLADKLAYLDHLGRDDRFGLKVGDWVEIVDDAIALHTEPNTPGPLVQIVAIDELDGTVSLKAPLHVDLPQYADPATNHPLLRRWDHHPDNSDATAGAIALDEDKWLTLEDGIVIQFQKPAGTKKEDQTQYRTGDYWLIPARTATGDVEWPQETDDQGQIIRKGGQTIPQSLPPHGVEHHYAPLAVVVGTTANDVRRQFKPVP